MALGKRVKVGGSYYRGHTLDIASSTGNYVLVIAPTTNNYAMNGLSVTPSSAGVGDYFSLYHYDNTASSGGNIIATLAENIYNLGGNISVMLDFASLELVNPGESLRFIYTNSATAAMTVYVTVETIK